MKTLTLKTMILVVFRVALTSCPPEIAGAGTYLELLLEDIGGRKKRLFESALMSQNDRS